MSSNAKELDSILNKYKASPKHVDSSFRSFYEKSNRSSGSLNSNKQNSQKAIDSKKGYINPKSNNQLNTSNPNLKQHTKQYQNYVSEAKNAKMNQESKYEQHQNLNQNKLFKQLQYADQKNVFHRLSRQSPLKYDSNIKPTQSNQLKKQNSQNSKLGKEDLDYKQHIFKENYIQNINNSNKQNIYQSCYSPPRNSHQIQNQKQQRQQLEHSKSPKQTNEMNNKNSNDSFLQIKQLHQHLNCYLGENSKFKQSEKQNDNYFPISLQKRSNSILSVQKERSSHSRSKTEQQTRSTSPQKKQNSEEISEIYVKMVEIECEQKELEMKQNILEQYKKLLKHKIEAKDKKQITKIKALQKDLQINLNLLDENLNDISNIEACDASQNNQFTPKDVDENKKQIRFQIAEEEQMSKSIKNLKGSQSARSFNNYPTKSNIKNKVVPEKSIKNQVQNQKQKVIYSDLVKKAKNQAELSETQQYKPCLPNILMQKIKDQGKQTEKQQSLNDKKHQTQQIQKQKSQSPSNQDEKKQKSAIQLMQAREDFLKKCSQQKKEQMNSSKINIKQQETQKSDNIAFNKSNSSKLINNNVNNNSSNFINNSSNTISNSNSSAVHNNNSSNTIHNNCNRQKAQGNYTININNYDNTCNNKNSPSFSKQKSITFEDAKQQSNRDIQDSEQISINSKLQQSSSSNSTFQNPSLNYRDQAFPINQHDMNLKINELRTCMTVSNLTAQEEENKNSSQFNYIVSENQWNSQVQSNGNISPNQQQALSNQFNTSQFIQSNKNIQGVQNNYSSYTIYGCPSQNDNNRYAEYNQNPDTNLIEIKQSISNLNNPSSSNLHPSLFVNDPKISFTNLNIENVQSSPKWQEDENNFNWKGAADGQLDDVMQCSASHSYIKQMIQQTNSTQTKIVFSNNDLKTKEFDEPEDFINKNINWQLERSSQKDIQALQQEGPYDLTQINGCRSINICSNDQFQATIPLYIQQRSDSPQNKQDKKPFTGNRLHANLQKQINKILEGNQQNIQQVNQEIKSPTPEEANNNQQKIQKPQEAFTLQDKLSHKNYNQLDLVNNQVFDDEIFDIENQKYDILEIQSPQHKLIREANLKSEKLQLLQFQLQEQLLKNLEEEEKKISFVSCTQNVVDDISSRNMKWLQSREKKLNQQKEQKSKKELDGCTFKPNLLSQKYSNDSHSPSKFSSNSQLDQQQQFGMSNDSNLSYNSKSPISRYENPSSNDKLSIFSKSQYGSSQVLSKQNSNSSNFVQKNKKINPKETKQQNVSYQQMNFKKRGSLHKIN